MTNKPMLSVERELRAAVEKALLAIKRIYQAGHDGIVSAGGSCDQPGVMFEGDPTVRELRDLLDESTESNLIPCTHPAGCTLCVWCGMGTIEARLAAVNEMVEEVSDDGLINDATEMLARLYDRGYRKPSAPTIKIHCNVSNVRITVNEDGSYTIDPSEQPAPVALVMPERNGANHKDWREWTHEEIGYNKALDDVARLNGVKL